MKTCSLVRMSYGSLSRMMAAAAVDTIVQREHALMCRGQRAAICLELESLIGEAQHTGALAAAALASDITDALHSSDHVEDIYASDADIQRDVAAAIVSCCHEHAQTQLPTTACAGHSLWAQLDELDAVVSYLSRALTATSCRRLLVEAATRADAKLSRYWPATRRASFSFADRSGENAIAIEDAILSTLLHWVESDKIALPHVEQLLQWPSGQLQAPAAEPALREAADRVRQHCGCLAHTIVLDDHTLRVRLVPLSQAAADDLDRHYDLLLESLQQCLANALSTASQTPKPDDPPASNRYPARNVVPAARAARRHRKTGG